MIRHIRTTTQIATTLAMKDLALLVSEKVGSCKRNSLNNESGVGCSVSHGYNAALLIAAKTMGLSDLTKQSDWYKQYESKT